MDKKHISIDIPGENDYKITGDRYSWNFAVYKGDVLVGQINKNWGFRDNYGVKVFDDALEVDVLLCCILIDSVYHDSDGQSWSVHTVTTRFEIDVLATALLWTLKAIDPVM